MKQGAERRRHTRIAIDAPVQVRCEQYAEPWYERATDISYGGMFVETDEAYPTGARVVFWVQPKGAGPIDGWGHVAFQTPGDAPRRGMGVKFACLLDPSVGALHGIVSAGLQRLRAERPR